MLEPVVNASEIVINENSEEDQNSDGDNEEEQEEEVVENVREERKENSKEEEATEEDESTGRSGGRSRRRRRRNKKPKEPIPSPKSKPQKKRQPWSSRRNDQRPTASTPAAPVIRAVATPNEQLDLPPSRRVERMDVDEETESEDEQKGKEKRMARDDEWPTQYVGSGLWEGAYSYILKEINELIEDPSFVAKFEKYYGEFPLLNWIKSVLNEKTCITPEPSHKSIKCLDKALKEAAQTDETIKNWLGEYPLVETMYTSPHATQNMGFYLSWLFALLCELLNEKEEAIERDFSGFTNEFASLFCYFVDYWTKLVHLFAFFSHFFDFMKLKKTIDYEQKSKHITKILKKRIRFVLDS